MKVRCNGTSLSDAQQAELGTDRRFNPKYDVKVGKSYLVLALSFIRNSPYFGSSAIVQIVNESQECQIMPVSLFEIIDPSVSKYWKARSMGNGELKLWPQEFYADFFHDDLSECKPATVQVFERVVKRLESEAESIADKF